MSFKLSNFQTFKRSHFQTFKLSHFQTFKVRKVLGREAEHIFKL